MIDYKYTAVNRLKTPHSYMYTLYQGSEFTDAYFQNRLENLKRFKKIKGQKYNNKLHIFLYSRAIIFLQDFLDGDFPNVSLKASFDWKDGIELDDSYDGDCIVALSSFNVSSEVNSESLLTSLINTQLSKDNESLIKFWLDLLVQRFEATKKIYKSYPANFRKGEGESEIVQLYWMFALSLTLFYCATKRIKYMSTLLKASDLLCSLDEGLLNQSQGVSPQGLSLILLVELLSIKLLSKTIDEVDFGFN